MYNVYTETRSCNHCCHGEAISIAYSECVFVALGIQQAMRMRPVVLSSGACQPLQFFPLYLIIGTIFEEKLLNIKCVL
jgi:hypothetical protein